MRPQPVGVALSAVLAAAVTAAAAWPATATAAAPAPAASSSTSTADRAPSPAALALPSLGVRSSLVPVGLLADGTLEVPADPAVPGWFTGGARPGEPGPVVVVGHVDSRRGPGVFARLRELAPGDTVEIEVAGGGLATYRVTASRQVPKDAFPTQEVYGAVPADELRLITCGGDFDRRRGSYTDNVVVDAVRV